MAMPKPYHFQFNTQSTIKLGRAWFETLLPAHHHLILTYEAGFDLSSRPMYLKWDLKWAALHEPG